MSNHEGKVRFTVEVSEEVDEWLKTHFPGTSKWYIIRKLLEEFKHASEEHDNSYNSDIKKAAFNFENKLRSGEYSS